MIQHLNVKSSQTADLCKAWQELAQDTTEAGKWKRWEIGNELEKKQPKNFKKWIGCTNQNLITNPSIFFKP